MVYGTNRSGRRNFGSSVGSSAMSRSTFMLGLAGAGVAAGMMGLSGTAKAQEMPPTVVPTDYGYDVYPTYDPSTDLYSVQWAVLFGAMMHPNPTVKLKYVLETPFNFNGINPILSIPGVMILYPVTVIGDGFDASGNPKTVIEGGGGLVPPGVLGPNAAPIGAITVFHELSGTIKIHGIWFDEQILIGVGGYIWNTLEVMNNKITNTISLTLDPYTFGEGQPFYFNVRMGVAFARILMLPETPGTLLVENNIVDNSDKPMNPPNQPEAQSIDVGIVTNYLNDSVAVRNNTVKNLGLALEANVNYGPSTILEGNVLTTLQSDFSTAGLWCCFHAGAARVANNNITVRANLPLPDPDMPFIGSGCMFSNVIGTMEISGNRIYMEPGQLVICGPAIHIGDPGYCVFAPTAPLQRAVIKNNYIVGMASHAIAALNYGPFKDPVPGIADWRKSSYNAVVGNNMTKFQPTGNWLFSPPLLPVHVYLGPQTEYNNFKGYFGGSDSIKDDGSNNFISGYTKTGGAAGGVGYTMSSTMRAKVAARTQAMGMLWNAMANAAKAIANGLKQQYGL